MATVVNHGRWCIVQFHIGIIHLFYDTFTWGDEYVPVQKAPLGMEFNETAKAIGFRDGDVLISADGVPLNVTVVTC